MLLGVGVVAWCRPGPPRAQLWARCLPDREPNFGILYWYGVRYPDGKSEEFLDRPPLGNMDCAILERRDGGERDGFYQTAGAQFIYGKQETHEGLIRPGDETLCEIRFQALLAELKRRDGHLERLEYHEPLVLDLPRNWPSLADLLHAAHGDSAP